MKRGRSASLVFFKVLFFLIVCLIGADAGENFDGKAPVCVRKKDNFHLYLLMGQSNMAGKNVISAEDRKTNPRIYMLNAENCWVVATDPLHPNPEGKTFEEGVGPGFPFAKNMISQERKEEVVIGLIPCAVDGSEIGQWMKGGDLYAGAVKRAGIAAQSGVIKGILWHQGESDGRDRRLTDSYGENIKKMVSDLRADLGSLPSNHIPFVAGKLGYFEYDDEWKGCSEINKILEAVITDIPRSALVESKGLKDNGDHLHFDAESQREFGRRYSESMLYLQGKKKR